MEKGALKISSFEMRDKLIRQFGQFWREMIMAHRAASSFPDMLLRVQIRSADREVHNLQVGMSLQEAADHGPFMPTGAIPEQDERSIGIGRQELFQMLNRNLSIHLLGAQDNLLAGMQVEGAVEIHLVPLRIRADHRGLASQSPNGHRGGLEVEGSFISG